MRGEKEKIDALKADLEAARAAFLRDDFDAAKLAVLQKPLVEYWLSRTLRMLDLLLPVLDDYQRRVLAEMASQMLSSGRRVPPPAPPGSASAGAAPSMSAAPRD